jgi:hypothetical protein
MLNFREAGVGVLPEFEEFLEVLARLHFIASL